MKRSTTRPITTNDLFRLLAASALIFFFYVFWAANWGPVVSMRLRAIDGLYKQRYARLAQPGRLPDCPVVIASIDDVSLREVGERWPWPRDVFARFLDRLSEAGAGPVAFDLSFSVPSEDPADDAAFAEAIRRHGRVTLGSYFSERHRHIRPIGPLAQAAADIGFLDSPRDPDNTNRRHWPAKIAPPNAPVYSLGLILAARTSAREPSELLASVYSRRPEEIPAQGYWSVYDYGPRDLHMVPFHKFLKASPESLDVKGRPVLVGATAEIFHDVYATPLGILPGVMVHANQTAALLGGRRLVPPSERLFYVGLLSALFALTAAFYRLRIWPSAAAALAAAALAYEGASRLFMAGVVLDLFSVFVMIAAAFGVSAAQRSLRLVMENRGLRYQSSRDGLTDLYTYRYMEKRLIEEFDKTRSGGQVVSLVIFDIDHFKRLNDAYGHEKGNEILIAFSRILKSFTRGDDLVARYGGEEFCILLPRQTVEEARLIAERVRTSLEEMNFKFTRKGESSISDVGMTVSAGVCSTESGDVFNGKELLRLADAALLTAKSTGRNKVCVHGFD